MKWNDLTIKEKSDLMSLFLKSGVGSLSDMRHIYDGESDTEGGYKKDTLGKREYIHDKYDPAGGIGLSQFIYGRNNSKGEEDQYWRAYLGLDNVVPRMNPEAKTPWDDKVEEEKLKNGEPASDFYGTTQKMDQHIQAIADTLNTGNILRNWEEYKQKYPELYSKTAIEHYYKTGKRVLENPNTWVQVGESRKANNGESSGPYILKDTLENNELSPLGMLADFGMMWVPEEGALYIHDTYDFPRLRRIIGGVPERPKEMKIRGRISFNPEKGSYLLRDGMANFYNGAKGIGESDLWDKWMEELYKDVK